MVDHKRPYWMLMPVTFTRLIGGDYYLLAGASEKVLRKYYLAAITLTLVMLISLISIFYAIEMLLHQPILEVFLASFLSSLFACMYIFLLNTFSKESKNTRSVFSNANLIRLFFILFMAFLISRPIATWIWGDRLDYTVANHKELLVRSHNNILDSFYEDDITTLSKRKFSLESQLASFPSKALATEIQVISDQLDKILEKKDGEKNSAIFQIKNSNFFLFRLKESSRHAGSWLVTLLITVIFLAPAYFIYSIDSQDIYHEQKKNRDRGMVINNFNEFLTTYRNIFQEKWQINTNYFTVYEDAPFNQIRKQAPGSKSSEDFHAKYFKRNK